MRALPQLTLPRLNLAATLSAGVAYETGAAALFARASVQPDAARKAAINAVFVAGRVDGWLADLDALYLFAAADAQIARLNWVQALYDATAISSPVFTADRGYTTDGSASYLDSNFDPVAATSPKFSQDSASFGIWVRTTQQSTASLAGWYDGTDGVTLRPRTATDTTDWRINQAASDSAGGGAVLDASGLMIGSRSSGVGADVYKAGVLFASGVQGSAGLNSATFKFGRATAGSFATAQFAAGVIGRSLNPTKQASIYTALRTYLVSIGAAS